MLVCLTLIGIWARPERKKITVKLGSEELFNYSRSAK